MIKIIPRKLFDCSGWLPPGVTDAMCDGPEDAPCASCGHMGEMHGGIRGGKETDACGNKDCDCPCWMEGPYEPDMEDDDY